MIALAAAVLLASAPAGLQPDANDTATKLRVSFSAAELSADGQVRAKVAKAASRVCLREAQARSGGNYAACRRIAVREALNALGAAR